MLWKRKFTLGTTSSASSVASPANGAGTPNSAYPWLVLLLVGVIGLGIKNLPEGALQRFPGAATSKTDPPEQIIDEDPCGYGECGYGRRLLAKKSITLYKAAPLKAGVPLTELSSIGIVHPGEWVRRDRTVVLSVRKSGRVNFQLGNRDFSGEMVKDREVKDGQQLILYTSIGEGCWRTWMDSKFRIICNVEVVDPVIDEGWLLVVKADGTRGWTNSGEFAVEEVLNEELAEVIGNGAVSREERLRRVDALIARGADLNGPTGMHAPGTTLVAIETKDSELVSALLKRGLKVGPCDVQRAPSVVLEPGGEAFFSFLLENGTSRSCLKAQPLNYFLSWGIGADHYPADGALIVVKLLLRHGAVINQPDSQGKTLFDMLDQGKDTSSIGVLRQALKDLDAQGAPDPEGAEGVPQGLPTSIEDLLRLAENAIGQGESARALIYSEQAVKLHPDSEQAREILLRVRRIRAAQ